MTIFPSHLSPSPSSSSSSFEFPGPAGKVWLNAASPGWLKWKGQLHYTFILRVVCAHCRSTSGRAASESATARVCEHVTTFVKQWQTDVRTLLHTYAASCYACMPSESCHNACARTNWTCHSRVLWRLCSKLRLTCNVVSSLTYNGPQFTRTFTRDGRSIPVVTLRGVTTRDNHACFDDRTH